MATKYEYQSEFARKYFDQGRHAGQEALRLAIREVLEARGLAMTDSDADKLAECTDIEQLSRWHRLALTAIGDAEIFD